MRVGMMPFAVLVALGLVAFAVWALAGAARARRADRGVSVGHAVVAMMCGTALWLGLCFVLMLLVSLGHSAHPLRDSWPQCTMGFVVLVAAPGAALVWLARRKTRS